MKKTKIVATIGPASETAEVLKELSESGVNVFRLNFSHGTHEDHGKKIDLIRSLKLPGAIMLDTKGPEIRTGEVRGALEVKAGDKLTLTTEKGVYEDTGKVSVNYKAFIDDVEVGTIIVIDSGIIKAEVKSIQGNDINCVITSGSGKITSRRHINLMGQHISLPTITQNDWKDIDFGIEKKVDFIALSFARSANDIIKLRKYCKEKGHVPHIIPKIENGEAVENLEEIVKASDGVMVARGDLACEIPFAMVPQVQKMIIELCDMYAKPTIVATQMLLSMVDNITPTRAEVSDVANAVYEGTDAVMTSDETTKGFDPGNVIRVMSEIARTNEQDYFEDDYDEEDEEDDTFNRKEVNLEIIKSVVRTMEYTEGIDGIVVITRTGSTAMHISNEKPELPIYAFTNSILARNTMSLLWGVYPKKIDFNNHDYEETIQACLKELKSDKSLKLKRCLIVSCYKGDRMEYPLITIRDLEG